MEWLSIFMAALNIGTTAFGEAGKKAAGYLQAQEYYDSARDVVAAHKVNVAERTKAYNLNNRLKRKATRKNISQTREKGAYDRAMVAQQGYKLLGEQRARTGSSGAAMDTGTTLSVGMQQISNNLFSERMVMADTKKNIDFLASEFVDWKTAQDFEFQSWKRKAKADRDAQYKKYLRMGDLTKKQADFGYVGGMVQGIGSTIDTYNRYSTS